MNDVKWSGSPMLPTLCPWVSQAGDTRFSSITKEINFLFFFFILNYFLKIYLYIYLYTESHNAAQAVLAALVPQMHHHD